MDEPCTVTMDSAGRLVIPAEVRRELALTGGTELILEVDRGTICLRPAATGGVRTRGRRWVVTSALVGPVPDHRDLRDERASRLVPK